MTLQQKIEEALAANDLSISNFTLSPPDEFGGILVKSMTGNTHQVEEANNALVKALPPAEYLVIFARSLTDPTISVRTRPAEL
jgi:hypothetical protein